MLFSSCFLKLINIFLFVFFFSSRRRHTRCGRDWSSDVCSSDLQHSNPVNTEVAYQGPSARFGTPDDPMVGGRVGGVNVFGGGLPLYNRNHQLVGAVGVSGDTSCADHNIAWRTRHAMSMDFVPAGVSGD